MAAPFFSTPFQPYVYQSPQDAMIPFQVLGGEAQLVQIMLKPDEKVIAKPGSMCFMSGSMEVENVFVPENEGSMWQWIFGKTVSSIVFRNAGAGDGFVGIGAPYLARVLPIDLAMFGGEILCQPDAFLCSVNDVKVSNTLDQRARNVIPGPEIFLRQKLSGQGLAFIVGGGSVVQKNLEVGEVLSVDVSCIAAVTATVNIQIKFTGTMRRALFGVLGIGLLRDLPFRGLRFKRHDYRKSPKHFLVSILWAANATERMIQENENLATAVLTGPGIVFIQSLPFHRFSQRIARAVTSPNMRENPKFYVQIAIFFFLAYVVIVSSLILTDV